MTNKPKETEDHNAPEYPLFHIGDLNVDSGHIIMADPCLLEREGLFEGENLLGGLSYCLRDENGTGFEVSLMTGIGDGVYPVIAEMVPWGDLPDGSPDWRIGRVYVEFTGPLRVGCRKRFPHPWEPSCAEGKTV